MIPIKQQLEALVHEGNVLYFVGRRENFESLKNQQPFGQKFTPIDITEQGHKEFYSQLSRLDALAHDEGPLSTPMWVRLDCVMIPTGYVGLAKPVKNCDEQLKKKLGVVDDYSGLVPTSEYCVALNVDGTWTSHTLGTIILGRRLGLLSKAIGLRAFGIERYTGIAQYTNSKALRLHTTFGPLLLRTAITECHDYPDKTFIYEQAVEQEKLEELVPPTEQGYSFTLDPEDMPQKLELQRAIKEGKRFFIPYPGYVQRDGKLFVPILEE